MFFENLTCLSAAVRAEKVSFLLQAQQMLPVQTPPDWAFADSLQSLDLEGLMVRAWKISTAWMAHPQQRVTPDPPWP